MKRVILRNDGTEVLSGPERASTGEENPRFNLLASGVGVNGGDIQAVTDEVEDRETGT
jgi:hypothetical protein